MYHHPSCPNYQPCEFACHLIDTPPPPYYPATRDAVQSTRLVQNLEREAHRYEKPEHHRYDNTRRSDSSERHVHFGPTRQHQHLIEDDRTKHKDKRRRAPAPRSILTNTSTDACPTIYIVTFATDHIHNTPQNVQRLVASQVPRREGGIAHLYTIDATCYPAPPVHLCERYSGISPVIQDAVLRDSKVRGVVRGAIHDLLSFVDSQHAGEKRSRGPKEVCMSICCQAGTHRSVAMGERIAQGVKGEVELRGDGKGVKVVVRHVSRVKGVGDPF